jgi:protein SSD1
MSMAGSLGGLGNAQGMLSQLGALGSLGMSLPSDVQGVPRGHGRRHSVNVVNKTTGPGASISYGNPYAASDGFDDGFAPPTIGGGHSRQASRADSSWRISESL